MPPKKTTPCKPKRTRVPLKRLKVEPQNYQFRAIEVDEDHVKSLKAAVERGDVLEPMTVWRRGEGDLVVVNGHHRYEAYRRSGYARAVPVTIHDCGAADAERLALAENARTQLPLSKSERMDAAWRLVTSEHQHSKAQVVKAAAVGDGTVAKMRRTKKTLEERGSLLPETWWQALQEAKRTGDEEEEAGMQEDIIQARANALDDMIGKEIGIAADRQWEALAEVLTRRLSRQRLESLTDHLWSELQINPEEWAVEDLY